MSNAWKVIWFESGKKLKKTGFLGDSPTASGVIDYAKSIIARGIPVENVHVVSQRKGFGPTAKALAKKQFGQFWCPYCLKWRDFRSFALRLRDGTVVPEDRRCPICTISINDYYVRKYNLEQVARATVTKVRTNVPKDAMGNRRSMRSSR